MGVVQRGPWITSRLHIARRALVVTALVAAACQGGRSSRPTDRTASIARVANLHAFARLYGVVRWFHPSDAASAIDWDRFAIDGAHRVIDAADISQLRARLTELFAPIAPTVRIVGPGEQFPDEPALHPSSPAGLDVIAWQHKGYGDSTIATGYTSKRRHRDKAVIAPGASFAALSQAIDATPYRGGKIRLRGKLRTAHQARGQMWVRVDRDASLGFFDNMNRHPVVSERWGDAEILGSVDVDATRIVFGMLAQGVGTTWYDELELAAKRGDEPWKAIEIENAGFEEPDVLASWRPGVGRPGRSQSIDAWHVSRDLDQPAGGAASLKIEPATKILTEELFEQAPAAGETADVELGSGLRARVPIALFSRGGHTIGDDPEVARRAQASTHVATSVGFDPVAGAADVIVVWNVFAHFWSYWNTVSVDWSAELDVALARALDARSIDDRVATLERLSAAVPDGHVRLNCPGEAQRAFLPVALDLVEGQLVVTTSTDKALERGDVILAVDGRPVAQLLAAEQSQLSGSRQWRIVRALLRVGHGRVASTAEVRLRRGTTMLVARVGRIDSVVSEAPSRPPIERRDDGVYYVDLSRTPMADLDAIMDRLAAAPGVVFDVRDRPQGNHDVLSHMVTRLETSSTWESIPLIIRPYSGSAPASWEETSSWNMPLLKILQPHITGRVAFLTGPAAISYAESFMALVEHYRLGAIVGAATAGTNGDIAEIGVPTGCRMFFTGRRVTNRDGSRFHLIGVQPTIPASRTIAGIIAGRDEVLDKALDYIRSAR